MRRTLAVAAAVVALSACANEGDTPSDPVSPSTAAALTPAESAYLEAARAKYDFEWTDADLVGVGEGVCERWGGLGTQDRFKQVTEVAQAVMEEQGEGPHISEYTVPMEAAFDHLCPTDKLLTED